jgi:hypothetical protein
METSFGIRRTFRSNDKLEDVPGQDSSFPFTFIIITRLYNLNRSILDPMRMLNVFPLKLNERIAQ